MSGIVGKNPGRGSGIVGVTAVAADAVSGSNIADDAIDSEHYTDGSIDNAHIGDDAIDSEHYAAGSIDTAHIADNQITLALMAGGTDGNIISYDASGDPVAIATGNDGQVLTSAGAGAPPAFEAAAAGGIIVQIVNVHTGAVATGTTLAVWDDTIPQNDEGIQLMTLAITPTSATNKLFIEVQTIITPDCGGNYVVAALFQDTTANALAVLPEFAATADLPYGLAFNHYMAAGTTSSTTFKVRAGAAGAGTTTFNGNAGSRFGGGVSSTSMTITEITV